MRRTWRLLFFLMAIKCLTQDCKKTVDVADKKKKQKNWRRGGIKEKKKEREAKREKES